MPAILVRGSLVFKLLNPSVSCGLSPGAWGKFIRLCMTDHKQLQS